jgi:predicted MFS family arabinose efflux permease
MESVFKNKNFTLLWFSQLISQIGNRMFQIAVLWWIIGQAHDNSGKYAAALLVLGVLPPIFFLNFIGRTIDRNPPLRVLLPADLAGALASLILVVLYATGMDMLIAFFASVFIFGTVQSFIEPTLMKMVPYVVPESQTTSAVAYLSSTQTLAFFSGAVIGAMLVERIGIAGVAALSGGTYLVSYFCDRAIKVTTEAAVTEPAGEQPKESALSVVKDLPLIRNILIGFGIVNMFGTPIMVILPLYTKNILQQSATALGLFEGCIWIGLFAGSIIASRIAVERTLLFVAANVFAFGAMIALPGVLVQSWFYGLCLFGMGASLGLLNVKIIAYFQAQIPNDKKGRFFSLLRAVTMAAMPIGFSVFGILADQMSVTTLSLAQGIGVMATSVMFVLLARGDEAKDKAHSTLGGVA